MGVSCLQIGLKSAVYFRAFLLCTSFQITTSCFLYVHFVSSIFIGRRERERERKEEEKKIRKTSLNDIYNAIIFLELYHTFRLYWFFEAEVMNIWWYWNNYCEIKKEFSMKNWSHSFRKRSINLNLPFLI